jgi:hypothetical protein
MGKVAGDPSKSTQLYHGQTGKSNPHTTWHEGGSVYRTGADGKAKLAGYWDGRDEVILNCPLVVAWEELIK